MPEGAVFDVIIVGAGPAGLSIGAELSKRHRVLVIEKNIAGKTNRSWFVPLNVVNESVMPFTYGGVTRFLTNTFSGGTIRWKAKQFDRYPYIDEKALLPHWVEVIKDNGSTVLDRCLFMDLDVKDGHASVLTDRGKFSARLVVDASGYDSLIVKKYGIKRKNLYWWSVYGAVGVHPNGLRDGLEVGDYMLWQTFRDTNAGQETSLAEGRPVFEYEVIGNDMSFPLILYLRKEKMDKDFMRQEFMHIIRNEDTTSAFHDIAIEEEKYGWYPSGDIDQQQFAEDNVVFVGDAGCWTTPCGWGMGFILDNYENFSAQVGKALDENALDRESLLSLSLFKTHERYEVLLNAVATHFLANASATQLDKFIGLFHKVDPLLCEKLFTLTITEEEVVSMVKPILSTFSSEELLHVLPREDFLLVLELIKNFAEDILLDEFHELMHLFGEHDAPQTLNDGFDFSTP